MSNVRSMLERVFDIWKVMKINRWPITVTLLVLLVLTVIPNGEDLVVRLLSIPDSIGVGAWTKWWFLCSLVMYGLTAWYWSRQVLSFQFHDWPPQLKAGEDVSLYRDRMNRIIWWHDQVPRWTGISAMALVALIVTYHMFSKRVEHAWGFLFVTWGLTILVGLFVYLRRRLLTPDFRRPPFKAYSTLSALPSFTKVVLIGSFLLLSITPFVVITCCRLTVIPEFGAVSVLLFAGASWIPFGSMAMYFGNHYRVPIFTLLFAWAMAVSVGNDNHPVSRCTGEAGCSETAPEVRPSIQAQFERWKADREGPSIEKLPFVIVASDGGGVRAAYWTTAVLAELHRHPQFGRHLFAISGVSGGSLGAIVYAGLMAEQDSGETHCFGWEGIRQCGKDILSHDFATPAFAMLMYPDFVARLLPFPCWICDRGAALELGWSNSWNTVVKSHGHGTDRLNHAFDSLWHKQGGEWSTNIPSLFLNSTSVEHGARVIKSSLRLSNESSQCRVEPVDHHPFRNVIDLDEALACDASVPGQIPQIPLRSAAHNSARFTWISPAGAVTKAGRLHVVDGGYFEATGATTAGEVLQEVLLSAPAGSLDVLIIHIENEPDEEPSIKQQYLDDLMAPIRTLFKARGARGKYAQSWLEGICIVSGCQYFEIGIEKSTVDLPLGWTLSKASIDEMDRQLDKRANYIKQKSDEHLKGPLRCYVAWMADQSATSMKARKECIGASS